MAPGTMLNTSMNFVPSSVLVSQKDKKSVGQESRGFRSCSLHLTLSGLNVRKLFRTSAAGLHFPEEQKAFSLFFPGEKSVQSLKFVKIKPVFGFVLCLNSFIKAGAAAAREKVNHGDKRLKSGPVQI